MQKHDATQDIESQFAKLDIGGDRRRRRRRYQKSENTVNEKWNTHTYDTYASNYSKCSNISFKEFLHCFQSNSTLDKEMLMTLKVVTKAVKQMSGNETSTEYYCVLISILKVAKTEITVAAILSLLGMSLKTMSNRILNQDFGVTGLVLMKVLTKYTVSENFLILPHCIDCLSLLLKAQEAVVWADVVTMRMLYKVLSFVTHTEPEVRKSAQHGICAIFKDSDIMKRENAPTHHPAAALVADYCIEQTNAPTHARTHAIPHAMTLLNDVIHQLPKSKVYTICENLLQIMERRANRPSAPARADCLR